MFDFFILDFFFFSILEFLEVFWCSFFGLYSVT